jgi:hypothetical protein
MGERRGSNRILVGNLREGGHLEGPGLDGSTILQWILKQWIGGMDWIDLALDMDRWRPFVNAVMDFRIS